MLVQAEPLDSLLKEILNRYNENPKGWRVFADAKGNMLVLGPGTGYRLKLLSVNPAEFTGVGVDISMDEAQGMSLGVPSYGYRPLSLGDVARLFSSLHQNAPVMRGLIDGLLGIKPVPTWDLKGESSRGVLTGPIIAHPDLASISRGQRELDVKLTLEANRLFRARYPFRAGIYG
jgi:hypothetical protein